MDKTSVNARLLEFMVQQQFSSAVAFVTDYQRLQWLATNSDRAPSRGRLKAAFAQAGMGKNVTYYRFKKLLELAESMDVIVPKDQELQFDFDGTS